jgi:hypothetical protein
MQADRRMYRKTNVQIDIHVHTYRYKDVQTYTDKQTDRQCRSAGRQAEKHTDVQKDDRILKDRQTDRQTDRTDKHRTDKHRKTKSRQRDRRQYICAVQKGSDRNLKIKKVSNRLRLRIFFLSN